MGSWGTAISSNDTYEEVYAEFMDLYDDKLEVSEITERLIDNYSELLNDYEENHNFWFTIAFAQWQCKALDKEIFKKVKLIISSGSDLKLWEELDAEKKDITKRKKVLDSFIEKLSTEKDKARKRKRKILRNSIFKKGDCLTFRLDNRKFGGALVLSDEEQTEYGMNLIATTTIEKEEKPTIDDFKNAMVLIQKYETIPEEYEDTEMVSWYYSQFYKKATIELEVIGNITVQKDFCFENDYTSASEWDMLKKAMDRNTDFIQERGKPEKKLSLIELYKKHRL